MCDNCKEKGWIIYLFSYRDCIEYRIWTDIMNVVALKQRQRKI